MQSGTSFLIGERIVLRPVGKEDLPYMLKWCNDPDLRRLTGEVMPMTESGAEDYLARLNQDPNRVWFMIALKDSGRVIGETGLLRMFFPWRTTDLSIILGEKDTWSQGYGTEVIHLLMDYAFGCLNFHRISIGVVGFNEKAIRFYEKAGFKKEGIQRDGYYIHHRYYDFVMMSILEDEFRAMKK